MNGLTKGLPSLLRAHKIQNKAKKVGFDFKDVSEAINKLNEEINEVLDVYKTENKAKIKDEVGDLLFSCVNVARLLEVDEEIALNFTIDKFIKRFSYIEECANNKGLKINDLTLEDMNNLWEESKNR